MSVYTTPPKNIRENLARAKSYLNRDDCERALETGIAAVSEYAAIAAGNTPEIIGAMRGMAFHGAPLCFVFCADACADALADTRQCRAKKGPPQPGCAVWRQPRPGAGRQSQGRLCKT